MMCFQISIPARIIYLMCFLAGSSVSAQQSLILNRKGYFEMPGLNVMVFADFYPEGHQGGVTIIQHGVRVAANGDLRLEPSPGQWSPVPKPGKLTIDEQNNSITQKLYYPDSSRIGGGVNPIVYPDLVFYYSVRVEALDGSTFKVAVDLEKPLPAEWAGRIGFNLELFPGALFGKSFLMDDQSGIFPVQPNGPIKDFYGEYLAEPLATGKKLVIAPEEDKQRLVIKSGTEPLELWDGRTNHNNGWFIVRSVIPANSTRSAVEWIITANIVPDWMYKPVIQVSQLGYHPGDIKRIVIEQDLSDGESGTVFICKLTPEGRDTVERDSPAYWGEFLRYKYFTCDFSSIDEPGLYMISYRTEESHPFRIDENVYDRHAWQPVLEYFLPVQMCHMRINEKYRVWHGACHLDDALMAPVDTFHFDGYRQGPATLTNFASLEHVHGLDRGGWHDAGDYDLRIESQIGSVWKLALMTEEFGLDYDATTIDQVNRLVEIHVPDGKSDVIQQIEHGLLTVLGGYRALGRMYRGIICSDLRQYVMLGDGTNITDNKVFIDPQEKMDDRWVFTEDNPDRELYVAAGLAAASRVLRNSNPNLSEECLQTALLLWKTGKERARRTQSRILALSELILTTGDAELKKTFIGMKDEIIRDLPRSGWAVAHVIGAIDDNNFRKEISAAMKTHLEDIKEHSKTDSPYGVPYTPMIWGAGLDIQEFGVEQYFYYKAWPEFGSKDLFMNALHFVLGVHPGENNASFASGIGANSTLVAYGVNRADWSFIPGGVASGTALIRPDLPEFKVWPFLWQQTEYVMGGGSEDYMFLVLAAQKVNNEQKKQ